LDDVPAPVNRRREVDPVALAKGFARPGRPPAAGERLDLTDADIRHDLELGKDPAFAKSRVYVRMFALVDRLSGKPVPRAVLPQIPLHSPKITRNLTSDWFANRVEGRYRTCLGRMRA
jgi:hypothetical protein